MKYTMEYCKKYLILYYIREMQYILYYLPNYLEPLDFVFLFCVVRFLFSDFFWALDLEL